MVSIKQSSWARYLPKQDDFFFCCCSTMQGFGWRTAAPAMTARSDEWGALSRLWLCLGFRGDSWQSTALSQSRASLRTQHQARHNLAQPVELSRPPSASPPSALSCCLQAWLPKLWAYYLWKKNPECSVSLLVIVAHWQDGEEMCISTQTENFPKAEVHI